MKAPRMLITMTYLFSFVSILQDIIIASSDTVAEFAPFLLCINFVANYVHILKPWLSIQVLFSSYVMSFLSTGSSTFVSCSSHNSFSIAIFPFSPYLIIPCLASVVLTKHVHEFLGVVLLHCLPLIWLVLSESWTLSLCVLSDAFISCTNVWYILIGFLSFFCLLLLLHS